MPGRDALSPLFLSADTCTGTMVQAVRVYMFVFVSVCAFVIAQKCQLNAQIPLCPCVCASVYVLKCVHNVSVSACAHGRHRARSATLEAAAFLLILNQSEEGSVTMSPAV